MKTAPLTSAIAAILLALPAVPAQAAYCGVPDDIAPIVKLTIATYPKISPAHGTIDQKNIKIVEVNGTYAYSVVDRDPKPMKLYWEKPTGTWHLAAANREPAGWSKQLLAFFNADPASCAR